MSTLTKFSATPYTGPAPTNRDAYVPVEAAAADARGQQIAAKVPNLEPEPGQDMPSFLVDKSNILDVLTALKVNPELRFTMPLDAWGVDYPRREKRFDVMYQLYSLQNNERVRLKVRVGEDEPVPSGVKVLKGLNWFERETWDMYGVRFDGHPNLRRILTHEAFQGHPLRKDYDPAQRWLLTEADVARLTPVIDERFKDADTD